MPDAILHQFSHLLSLAFGLDAAITALCVQAGLAVGSLCGVLWGTWQTSKATWRTACWLGVTAAVGWHAYRKHRAYAKRGKALARQIATAEAVIGQPVNHYFLPVSTAQKLRDMPPSGTVDNSVELPELAEDLGDGCDAGPKVIQSATASEVRAAASKLGAKFNRHPKPDPNGLSV